MEVAVLTCLQDILKEEFENDPDFLKDYSVHAQSKTGGPAAPQMQAQTA